MYFHPLWNPKFFIFQNKVLLIHLLLVWTLLWLLQTLHRIIPNLFYPTNLSLITSPKQILIANLAYILLLTKQTRKSMSSTGVTKPRPCWLYSGLPIYELTTTANVHDSTVALDILADTHTFLPITECTFLADKGYDVKNIYNQVQELYQGECIIPLNKRSTKNPKLLPQGNPVCDAGLAMWKDGKFSDNGRTRQKFCCPLKSSKDADCPCHHKNFYNGKKHRGCTKYITIPDDLRLSVDRDSKHFKSNYSLRTECERYNSRFKNTGQERMWVRNKSSVTNLNTIAHISLLAVAVAAITTGTGQSYRKLKAVKRIA